MTHQSLIVAQFGSSFAQHLTEFTYSAPINIPAAHTDAQHAKAPRIRVRALRVMERTAILRIYRFRFKLHLDAPYSLHIINQTLTPTV